MLGFLGRAATPVVCLLGVTVLSACEESPEAGDASAPCGRDEICGAASDARVRAIKPYVVTQSATGVERRFSGEIVAVDSAPLSFPVGGRVDAIHVAAGDDVEQGALLASLDQAPFQINVESAEADLSAAQSSERALEIDLQRQRDLHQNGWVSDAALDQAEVQYDNARSQASVAQSRLALAERDLASTRMLAPFSGVVASVEVEPFTEIVSGQSVIVVQSGDAFEVIVSVPDAVIGKVSLGSQAAVDVATLPLCGCVGHIVEIGAVSSAGNAVDVVVAVTQAPPGLRAGMSAVVAVTLGEADRRAGYFIPLASIAPGDAEGSAVVFRFDRSDGVVRRTPVRFVGAIATEAVAVEGLQAGDIVAAAGVSFLRDGQRVRLLDQR